MWFFSFHSSARLLILLSVITRCKSVSEHDSWVPFENMHSDHSRDGGIGSLGGKNGKRNKYLYFSFCCLTKQQQKNIARHEKKHKTALGENIKGTWREKKPANGEKSATKREKYVKINCKSIECDVKIKFIRGGEAQVKSPWEFISRAGRFTIVYMDMFGITFFVVFSIAATRRILLGKLSMCLTTSTHFFCQPKTTRPRGDVKWNIRLITTTKRCAS